LFVHPPAEFLIQWPDAGVSGISALWLRHAIIVGFLVCLRPDKNFRVVQIAQVGEAANRNGVGLGERVKKIEV
jgi:hypothetical protein